MSDFNKLASLFESKSTSLREMATQLGYDPSYFYIGTDLSGVDIKGQDLRGMNLGGTNVLAAKIDVSTRFDAEIEDQLKRQVTKRYLQISKDLLPAIRPFYSTQKFRSSGWFIKNIIPRAAQSICANRESWISVIDESPDIKAFFGSSDRIRVELLINDLDYNEGLSLGRQYGGHGSSLTALIIIGVLDLIKIDPSDVRTPVKLESVLHEFRSFPQFHGGYY